MFRLNYCLASPPHRAQRNVNTQALACTTISAHTDDDDNLCQRFAMAMTSRQKGKLHTLYHHYFSSASMHHLKPHAFMRRGKMHCMTQLLVSEHKLRPLIDIGIINPWHGVRHEVWTWVFDKKRRGFQDIPHAVYDFRKLSPQALG